MRGYLLAFAIFVLPFIALLLWDRFIYWYRDTYHPAWHDTRIGTFDATRGCGGMLIFFTIILSAFVLAFLLYP